MKYYFIVPNRKTGEPSIHILTAYGYRRKNGMDQVFAKTNYGMRWIFATIADREYMK